MCHSESRYSQTLIAHRALMTICFCLCLHFASSCDASHFCEQKRPNPDSDTIVSKTLCSARQCCCYAVPKTSKLKMSIWETAFLFSLSSLFLYQQQQPRWHRVTSLLDVEAVLVLESVLLCPYVDLDATQIEIYFMGEGI